MTMEQIEFGSDLDKKLAARHILGGSIQTFLLIHPLLTLKRLLGSKPDIWIALISGWGGIKIGSLLVYHCSVVLRLIRSGVLG